MQYQLGVVLYDEDGREVNLWLADWCPNFAEAIYLFDRVVSHAMAESQRPVEE